MERVQSGNKGNFQQFREAKNVLAECASKQPKFVLNEHHVKMALQYHITQHNTQHNTAHSQEQINNADKATVQPYIDVIRGFNVIRQRTFANNLLHASQHIHLRRFNM
jgi:hypothetical protein